MKKQEPITIILISIIALLCITILFELYHFPWAQTKTYLISQYPSIWSVLSTNAKNNKNTTPISKKANSIAPLEKQHNAATSNGTAPKTKADLIPIEHKDNPHKMILPEETKANKNAPVKKFSVKQRWIIDMGKCHGIHEISTNKKVIALTFDDGPAEKHTKEILSILDKYKIKATFFLVGKNAMMHPNLVKDIFNNQHALGNHSFSHIRFSTVESREKIQSELDNTNAIIYQLTGIAPKLFRPPYGVCSEMSTEIAVKSGYKTILWSDDYDINKTGVAHIIKDVVGLAHPGGIILLHDGHEDIVKALPIILQKLQAEGYTFLTVPELLNINQHKNATKLDKGSNDASLSTEAQPPAIQTNTEVPSQPNGALSSDAA